MIIIGQAKLLCVGERVKDVVIKLPLESLKIATEKYPEFEPLKRNEKILRSENQIYTPKIVFL